MNSSYMRPRVPRGTCATLDFRGVLRDRCGMRRLVPCVLALAGFGCGSVQTESCPGLEPPANGSVSAPDTSAGSTASYLCAAGFMLDGPSARTCQADGTWSGSDPTCTQMAVPCM